jgi:hypothetical protein
LQADWTQIVGYAGSGTFVSSVLDAGAVATWGTVNWSAILPPGTAILVETSSGNVLTPDDTWSAWSAVSESGNNASPAARYLRYRLTFTTMNPQYTASLQAITFTWA